MATATPAPVQQAPALAVRPALPVPLWERHRLFQEPVYTPDLELVADDEEGDD